MRGFSGVWKALLLATAVALPIYGIAQTGGGPDRHGEHMRGGGRHHGGPGGFAKLLERNAEQLKLDDTTLTQIRGIEEDSRTRSRDLFEKQRKEQDVMRTLLDAAKPDESAILSQADLIGRLDTDLRKEELRSMLAIRRLLTPEQAAAVAALRKERRGRGEGHGRRHSMPQQDSPESQGERAPAR